MEKNRSFIIGQISASAIALATIIFAISLIWEMIDSSEFAKNLGYVASILLALSVVIAMACFYSVVRERLKIFALLALIASIIYAPLCIGTYFLQLTSVALNPLQLSAEVLEAINFKPGSPIFSVDMLGYSFLCLSTLAGGFALTMAKDRLLRALWFFHGALVVPTLAAPIVSGLFLAPSGEADLTGHYVLLFWCIVFIPIGALFVRYFHTEKTLEAIPNNLSERFQS